jgi:hypothetical protein
MAKIAVDEIVKVGFADGLAGRAFVGADIDGGEP